MLKPLSLIALAALGLAACSPADLELDGDLEGGAADPYWTFEVVREENRTTISIVGEPAVQGGVPVKTKGEKDEIILTSTTPQGDFVMRLTHKECYDGLAETPRPWTVAVDWKGEALQGCARAR